MSNDLQTSFPGMLHTLTTYGPSYLTHEEFEVRLNRHVSAYYKFLGKSWLLGRDKKFWDYHRMQLSQSRIGFSRWRLFTGTARAALGAALNPGIVARRLSESKNDRNSTSLEPNSEKRSAADISKRTHLHEG
jgi:hypothetical protein